MMYRQHDVLGLSLGPLSSGGFSRWLRRRALVDGHGAVDVEEAAF